VTTPPSSAWRESRLAGVIASVAVLATTIVVVGAITPGYSQMADTVSRLGSTGQPHAWLERIGVTIYGLLIIAGAGPLAVHAPTKERVLAYAVGAYGLAAIITGVAPKDPPNAPHTTPSQLHVDASIVGGAAILLAMLLIARYSPLRLNRVAAVVLGVATCIGVVVFRFTWGSSTYGLVERVLLAIASLWLAALARQQLHP
jgi:hypothetical membrane protein